MAAARMNERRPFPRLHIPDAKPVRLDETLAAPGGHCRRPLFSDVADVRQHLLAEQFERFHQLVGMFRARGLERQIDDSDADLFAALLQLRDDLVRPAAEVDRQHPVDIGRPPPLAGDVALVEFQQRGADLGLQREDSLPTPARLLSSTPNNAGPQRGSGTLTLQKQPAAIGGPNSL